MTNVAKEPPRDWPGFVGYLAQHYAAGRTAEEAGSRVQGLRVSWTARISQVKLWSEHAPGLRVNMELIELPLANGMTFVAKHLFLPIRDSEAIERCQGLEKGDVVHFEATVQAEGLFSTVDFALDEEQSKVFLELWLGSIKVT